MHGLVSNFARVGPPIALSRAVLALVLLSAVANCGIARPVRFSGDRSPAEARSCKGEPPCSCESEGPCDREHGGPR
jgi:hypothetical protein